MSSAWKQVHRMKRFTVGTMTTPEYYKKLRLSIRTAGLDSLKTDYKSKAEEDLDSLKTDYKKLRLSIRTAGLGKTTLEKDLLEYQNEEARLKAWVAELEKSLHLYRSRNSMIDLRASLGKIEELKGK
ncbi:hypothetical protein Godav_029666 [Gossypium davidsonii]|uniref:Uncharacterized protein n=1 Tax=Gossypium davidsonii TaxID=34287 RepID=A0A7J8TGU4_GOSDV|nr:hypothetical protein [Gossypium davidsonii]